MDKEGAVTPATRERDDAGTEKVFLFADRNPPLFSPTRFKAVWFGIEERLRNRLYRALALLDIFTLLLAACDAAIPTLPKNFHFPIAIAAAIAGTFALATALYFYAVGPATLLKVPPKRQVVYERFGDIYGTSQHDGLNLKSVRADIRIHSIVDTSEQEEHFHVCITTSDRAKVDLPVVLHYRIADARPYVLEPQALPIVRQILTDQLRKEACGLSVERIHNHCDLMCRTVLERRVGKKVASSDAVTHIRQKYGLQLIGLSINNPEVDQTIAAARSEDRARAIAAARKVEDAKAAQMIEGINMETIAHSVRLLQEKLGWTPEQIFKLIEFYQRNATLVRLGETGTPMLLEGGDQNLAAMLAMMLKQKKGPGST